MSISPLFPLIDHSYILSFQFSSWYPAFSDLTIKSETIRPLSQSFRDYLDSDGVFVPEGSEDAFVSIILRLGNFVTCSHQTHSKRTVRRRRR